MSGRISRAGQELADPTIRSYPSIGAALPRFGDAPIGARIDLVMTLETAEPTDAALMQEIQQGSRIALESSIAASSAARTARPSRRAMTEMRGGRRAGRLRLDVVLAGELPARAWTSRHWAMSIVRHRASYLAQRRTPGLTLEERTTLLEAQPADDDVPSDVESHAEAARLEQLLVRLPEASETSFASPSSRG